MLRTRLLNGSCWNWASHAVADSTRFFDTPDTSDYIFRPGVDGSTGAVTFPSAMHTRYPENNTVHALYFRGEASSRRSAHVARRRTRRGAAASRRSRAAAMERRTRRARRPVPSAEQVRTECAAAHAAVSRRAPACRAESRRLHRQRQCRAYRAGVPSGGDGRAARDWMARQPGLRSHRHTRHEPRLVSVAADGGARAANPRAGAQPHLAVLCRCGMAGPVDHTRPSGARRVSGARPAQADVAADQPSGLSRSHQGQENAAGVCEVRSDVSRSICHASSLASSSAAAFRTSWRCCHAGTTPPASRHSSFSTDLCWRGFWTEICRKGVGKTPP